jgi:molybdopterin converting factor subunit 1
VVQIDVLLFASYAEAFGTPRLRVDVPDTATAGDVLGAVRALGPAGGLPPAALAVNQEYAPPGRRVVLGDEVAVIPPVAGG